MVALKIEDKKRFTSELFIGELFDRFWLCEANVVTFSSFSVDGRIRKGYYSQEECAEGQIGEYANWSSVRPFCFSLIRGRRLPESFRIVLKYPSPAVGNFLAGTGLSVRADQVGGLYLNIHYEEERIMCFTGVSLNFFTLDKLLERAWDEKVCRFFREKQIAYTVE